MDAQRTPGWGRVGRATSLHDLYTTGRTYANDHPYRKEGEEKDMSDRRRHYKSEKPQLSRRKQRKKNRVEAAVEAARTAFDRKEPGGKCEVEKLEHLAVGPECTCDREASWLAVYTMERNTPLQAVFLCAKCKDKVRKLLRYGYNDHHSFVLVKDWRLAQAGAESTQCSR
mgnify:CR=1 FL=1